MAAKYLDAEKLRQQLFKRTEGYAYSVRKLYVEALEKVIDIVKGTELLPGMPFNFSDYGFEEQVTPIFRNLYSKVYQTIKSGVVKEWNISNDNTDALVKAVFGKRAIEDGHFAKYFARNKEAVDAFFTRKTADNGLNLSQRVWKYTGMYKSELEDTLELAMGEGTPAMHLASKIKTYLNDPDRFYRRFRVKIGENDDGEPIYGYKWKRRRYDPETGLYRWDDEDPRKYHPGQGVYRSSARNAQRLARTETNVAYRTAEYDRWQQMEFVVGIEIKLSNNHPYEDICDELAGVYPKDFKWTGWHPNCRCYQVPVLASEGEVDEMVDKILDGEDPGSVDCKGEVSEMPEQFKSWVEENEGRIEQARERGTLPYFVKDNEGLISGEEPGTHIPTPKEIAAARHAARTAEQIQTIKDAWNFRKETISISEDVLDKLDGISDIDLTPLQESLNSADYKHASQIAQALQVKVAQIQNLTWLDDPFEVARQFSLADAQGVNRAINTTISNWLSAHGYKSWETAGIAHKKAKLEYEIKNLVSTKKYATWEPAVKAYEKLLVKVQDELDWHEINNSRVIFSGFKTKSSVFKGLLADLQAAVAAKDKTKAQNIVLQLEAKQKELEAAAAKKAAKAKIAKAGKDTYSETNTAKQLKHLSEDGDRPITVRQQLDKIKQMLGCTEEEAADYFRAVNGFSYQWDYEIRQVQCGNLAVKSKYGHKLEEIQKRADDIETFIEKSPKWSGSMTFRGMTLSQKEYDNLIDELKQGIADMQGSASWSTVRAVSERFAGYHYGETSPVYGDIKNIKVVLYSKTQERATSIQHLSEFFSEYEVLVSKTAKYKFVKIEKLGDYIFVMVEPSI